MGDGATIQVLAGTAVTLAALHTLIGVDHSLPFVVLGRTRGWSLSRTLSITALCGVGHVLSSIVLGAVGIGLGVAVQSLSLVETTRGGWAAWLLIGFGLVYAVHALWRNARTRPHSHPHAHADGVVHSHAHDHTNAAHAHPHTAGGPATVWALFIIFVLGPCEPLIPLLMAPAALHSPAGVALVAALFGGVTILTMLAVVTVAYLGLSKLAVPALSRHADVLAGLAIAGSGLAIQALGI